MVTSFVFAQSNFDTTDWVFNVTKKVVFAEIISKVIITSTTKHDTHITRLDDETKKNKVVYYLHTNKNSVWRFENIDTLDGTNI